MGQTQSTPFYRKLITSNVLDHANAFPELRTNRYSMLQSCGAFKGSVAKAKLSEKITLTLEEVDCSLIEQACYVPDNKVLIANLSPREKIAFNGTEASSSTIFICSGRFLHAVGKGQNKISMIMFDRCYFNQQFGGMAGLSQHLPFELSLKASEAVAQQFVEIIFQCLDKSSGNDQSHTDISLIDRTIDAVAVLFEKASRHTPNHESHSTRSYIVKQACELIHRSVFNQELSIDEICSTLRISRRTLQYSYQSIIGLSPIAYMRYIKLNAARNMILNTPHDKVYGIATDTGFNHFGRFSQYYREFYGELPSQTLAEAH